MVDKRDFYTGNVWKIQISRRTLVQSAYRLAVNKFPAVYIIYHAHSTDFEEKIEGL